MHNQVSKLDREGPVTVTGRSPTDPNVPKLHTVNSIRQVCRNLGFLDYQNPQQCREVHCLALHIAGMFYSKVPDPRMGQCNADITTEQASTSICNQGSVASYTVVYVLHIRLPIRCQSLQRLHADKEPHITPV